MPASVMKVVKYPLQKTRDIDNPIISDGIEVQSVVISDISGRSMYLLIHLMESIIQTNLSG